MSGERTFERTRCSDTSVSLDGLYKLGTSPRSPLSSLIAGTSGQATTVPRVRFKEIEVRIAV